MKTPDRPKSAARGMVARLVAIVVAAGALVLLASGVAGPLGSQPLSPVETACVGSWSYLSPEHRSPTRIVYRFGQDRSVREEHYYLTSADPTVPRITMRGRWRVDVDNRMTVEPNSGIAYFRDAMSKTMGEHFGSTRKSWPRPILRRFYAIKAVSKHGIDIEASGSDGPMKLTMTPIDGSLVPQPARALE